MTLSDTTASLGRVYFQVDSAASSGTVPVTFDTTPTQTLVLDDTGGSLGYSTRSGSIAVTAVAVPEPSTLILAIGGGLLLGGYGLHRRRRSRVRGYEGRGAVRRADLRENWCRFPFRMNEERLRRGPSTRDRAAR